MSYPQENPTCTFTDILGKDEKSLGSVGWVPQRYFILDVLHHPFSLGISSWPDWKHLLVEAGKQDIPG